MPPAPEFDYYQALEIDRTATTEEIKSSYRRLARVHHPDKNLDNPESTAAFQKIQIAHETLSDERSRSIYDARSSRSEHPTNGRSPFYSDSDSDGFYDYEYADEDSDISFENFMRDRFSRGRPTGFAGFGGAFFYDGNFGFYAPREMSPGEARKRREEQEAENTSFRKRMAEEMRQRKEAEEAQAKARAMAKAAEEMERKLAKERRELAERARVEKIWFAEKATSQAEKQDLCLHSEVWAKEKLQKKFKCTSCGQKRGMVGHRCPHCSLLVCQVCLNKFNELRKAP